MNCFKIFSASEKEQEGVDQSSWSPNRLKPWINVLSVLVAWAHTDAGCIYIAIQDGIAAYADLCWFYSFGCWIAVKTQLKR